MIIMLGCETRFALGNEDALYICNNHMNRYLFEQTFSCMFVILYDEDALMYD